MHRKALLVLGLAALAGVVATLVAGLRMQPDAESIEAFLAVNLSAALVLMLGQFWMLLYSTTLAREVESLFSERSLTGPRRQGIGRLARRVVPWAAAALVSCLALFLLSPALGHRWAPEWLFPAAAAVAFAVEALAVRAEDRALAGGHALLRELDATLTEAEALGEDGARGRDA